MEAVEHEIFLHAKFNVKLHPKFYNKSNQTSTGFDRFGVKQPNTLPDGCGVMNNGLIYKLVNRKNLTHIFLIITYLEVNQNPKSVRKR